VQGFPERRKIVKFPVSFPTLARHARPWNRDAVPNAISCSSSIADVVVYGRGAVVTRIIDLPPDLPEGLADVEVDGITPLAEAGSVRAEIVAQDRRIVALQSSLVVPPEKITPGPSLQRVEDLDARIERLESERGVVQAQRTRFERMQPCPAKVGSLLKTPLERVNDSLAVGKTLDEILAGLDAKSLELEASIADCQKEREAARLASSQAQSSQRMGKGHPTRRVVARLDGTGPVESVRLIYTVKAARWWPVYTLRLAEGGASATWWVEALVAQLSGEDWTSVRLSLCTASLVDDVRLPELASMRLGRAKPEKRRGYRPPPADLERMFVSFDVFFSATVTVAAQAPRPVAEPPAAAPMQEMAKRSAPMPQAPQLMRAPAPPPAMAMPAPAPPPPRAPAPPPPAPGRASIGSRTRSGAAYLEEDGFAMTAPLEAEQCASPEPPEPQEIEPADAWLDFDGLRLGQGLDLVHRGRLYRQPDPVVASRQRNAASQIDGLAPAPMVRDPLLTRGSFDHRYDAQGRAEVPSDGRTHRITLASAPASTSTLYRTVPIEAPEVYRELLLTNPFDSPILDGPVDVYVEGSLLTTSEVGHIDRGGSLRIGLGVEDRIRVARNVQVEEETTGLLGGTSSILHTIRIDLRSSLGKLTTVEVLDRVPDTDDKNVEVKLVKASHQGARYTQADRGAPIRGGWSWPIALPAGGSETLAYSYRINLPSKNEIVGGNRRD